MSDKLEGMPEEPLVGAIARAWCHPGNTHKQMDQHLVMAIKEEVEKWIAARAAQSGEGK